MSNDDSSMTPHEYDGIQELDNQLPRWWVWLFYITTAFAPIYIYYYHFSGKGDLPVVKYEKSVEAHEAVVAQRVAEQAPIAAAAPQGPSTDEAVLAAGKAIYGTHCFACHTETGGGLVGPNLTDDQWLHGPTFADTVKTVTMGVPEKGMISWQPILKPDEIQAVCSYLYTLRGTQPANGKSGEGTQYLGSDSPSYTGPAEDS